MGLRVLGDCVELCLGEGREGVCTVRVAVWPHGGYLVCCGSQQSWELPIYTSRQINNHHNNSLTSHHHHLSISHSSNNSSLTSHHHHSSIKSTHHHHHNNSNSLINH